MLNLINECGPEPASLDRLQDSMMDLDDEVSCICVAKQGRYSNFRVADVLP